MLGPSQLLMFISIFVNKHFFGFVFSRLFLLFVRHFVVTAAMYVPSIFNLYLCVEY